jgi:hypothetical protein
MSRSWISLDELARDAARLRDDLEEAKDVTEQSLARVRCLHDELSELRAEIRRQTRRLGQQAFSAGPQSLESSVAFVALCQLGEDPGSASGARLPQVSEVLPRNASHGITFKARACFKIGPVQAGDVCDAAGCARPAKAAWEACATYPGWKLFLCASHRIDIEEKTDAS